MITAWSHHQTGDNLPQTDPFHILHGMYLSVTETKRRHTKPVCFQSAKCSQRQQIIKMDIRQNGHLSKWAFIKLDISDEVVCGRESVTLADLTAESCLDWKPCVQVCSVTADGNEAARQFTCSTGGLRNTHSHTALFFSPAAHCVWLYSPTPFRTQIVQLVQRPTKKPGVILKRVRVPGAAWDFSPRVSFLCRLSDGVRTAPCAVACINIRVHVTNPRHCQSYCCLDTGTLHTLVGMGSAALAAIVLYPGKATRISRKGQGSTLFFISAKH